MQWKKYKHLTLFIMKIFRSFCRDFYFPKNVNEHIYIYIYIVIYLCIYMWNTWSNRKIWPWNMEWSRAKTNRVLPRKCTDHNKHPLPTAQEKTLHMDITRWSKPKSDWLYSLQPKIGKLYTVSKNKTGSWLWLRSWTPYCQIQTEIEENGENH